MKLSTLIARLTKHRDAYLKRYKVEPVMLDFDEFTTLLCAQVHDGRPKKPTKKITIKKRIQ
jgi:hypothetical protein